MQTHLTSHKQRSEPTDAILIHQAHVGDQDAFEMLVNRYSALLFLLISRIVRDEHLAHDVLQHVFLQLYRSLPTLVAGETLRAWLSQVARHCSIDELRRRRLILFSDIEPFPNGGEYACLTTLADTDLQPEEQVELHELRQRLLDAIETLPVRYRAVVLLRDGDSELERVTQIGTDHGLLPTPVRLPSDGLVLASAERADLLVDFSDLEPGSELMLLNTASAPFDGASFPAARALEAANLEGLLPFPQVMCFRVIAGPSAPRSIPTVLANDYAPPPVEELADAPRRAIALVERELEGQTNMLTMRELRIVEDDHTGPLVTVTDGERMTRYRAVAAHFEDRTTFFPMLGELEVWQLINLTGDTHPIHVHLDPFQILARHPMRYQIPDAGIEDLDITASVILGRAPDDELSHAIDDNERGLKDTIRVNPNEIVEIAVRFTAYSGRYMYHCHILEHEDREMMRPFVTMAPELMPFMA